MKWLIIGANGQLGRCIQRRLRTKAINFVALSHNDLDIADNRKVTEIISLMNPTVVINAAAYTSVEEAENDFIEAFKVNQLGAANLAVASKLVGAKLIHFSTDYVFGGDAISPKQVSDPTTPLSVYGKSKLAGELQILEQYPENSIIIRTAWLYSAYGKNFYKTILSKALTGIESVRVVNDQQGQPTSALDLADLTIKAVTMNVDPGVFHGTNAGSCSWYEFAKYIFELVEKDTERVIPILSSEFQTNAQRPMNSVLDNRKWSEYGISPLGPWRESVNKALPDMIRSLDK